MSNATNASSTHIVSVQSPRGRIIRRTDIEKLIDTLINFLDAVDAPYEDLEDETGESWLLQDDVPPRRVLTGGIYTPVKRKSAIFPSQTVGEAA